MRHVATHSLCFVRARIGLWVTFSVLLGFPAAAAAECEPTLIKTLPGQGYLITASGDTVYSVYLDLDDSSYGLIIYDASDSANPIVIGSMVIGPAQAEPGTIAVNDSGDTVIITFDSATEPIQVIDVSDPTDPKTIGTLLPPAHYNHIRASGDMVYGRAGGEFHAIDVSDPANPTFAGSMDGSPFFGAGLAVSGTTVYGSGLNFLRVVDFSDPAKPELITEIPLSGYVGQDLDIAGETLYSLGRDGLRTLDVSQPLNPKLLGSVEIHPQILGGRLMAYGAKAYVHRANNTYVINGASQPTIVFHIKENLFSVQVEENKLAVSGGHLWAVAPLLDLRIFDIHLRVTCCINGACAQMAAADCIGAGGTYLGQDVSCAQADCPQQSCAGDVTGDGVVDVFDLIKLINNWGSCPSGFSSGGAAQCLLQVVSAAYSSPGSVFNMDVSGDTAYMAKVADGGNPGLTIIDITHPLSPEVLSLLPPPPGITDFTNVAVSGETAYITAFPDTILVADVSDRENPSILGSVVIGGGNLEHIAASGTAVYAHGQVIDASDPANPVVVNSFVGNWSLAVSGDTLYSASPFRIYDISDPLDPVLQGSLVEGVGTMIAVSGNLAFATTGKTLNIIDVSDPTDPVLVGSEPIPGGSGLSLAAEGAIAYVGTSGGMLHAIDASDPVNPTLIATNRVTSGSAWGVAVSNSYAYVAQSQDGGVTVVDARMYGPCCVEGACVQAGELDCLAADGTFLGAGDSCAEAACAPGCAADLTGDGVVDVFDLIELINNWGPCS